MDTLVIARRGVLATSINLEIVSGISKSFSPRRKRKPVMDRSHENRRVNPIEETNYHENFDRETIIIDVEYEDITDRDEEEIINVKEELILYNRKGKIVTHVKNNHNINKTT